MREIRRPDLPTFSPTTRHSTLKCQLASACVKEARSGKPRRYFSFDVTQAYLKGDATEAELMYVLPPAGYRTYDENGTPLVWRLNTPLYGQGDAGRIWYKTMSQQLIIQGFVQSHGDPCLFVKTYSDGTTLDLTLYVDDIFATTDADELAIADLEELNKRFAGTLQENPEFFLGLNIKYVGLGRIKLSCETYINTLKGRFPTETMGKEGRDITIPSDKTLLEAYEGAIKANAGKERAIDPDLLRRYGTKVGSLIYLVPTARCDAAATIGILARCLSFPTLKMEKEADRCLRYVYSTSNLGIVFDGSKGAALTSYSDSDWAVRHSTTGFCIIFAGAPVGYSSKRQHCIALSSTEAEVMAASQAATEVVYFQGILRDLGMYQGVPTPLYIDNTGAEELARELKSCSRSRHITRRNLKVRELEADEIVRMACVATDDNPADILTKPLLKSAFIRHRDMLMSPK